jgi:type I restriction enzyme, S subunit
VTLPTGWVETTLGEIAETKLGKMLDGAKNKGQPTPYLRNISVRWGSFDLHDLPTMLVTPDELTALAVRDGDLFVCEGGVPGRCAVWRGGDQRIVFQKAIHRIRPLDGISADYLQRFLVWSAGNDAFDDLLTGTTIKHLPQVGLQRIALPLPPLAEQRRIVAKLDTLTARLRRARTELDRVAAMAKRIRKASVDHAFKGLANGAPLSSLTTIVTSGSRGWAQHYASEGAAFIRVGDVRRCDVRLDLRDVQRVQPPVGAEGLRTALKFGDIVVTITADLGRVGVVPDNLGPAFVNQHVALVRPSDSELSPWIAWYLSSPNGQHQLLAKDRGATKAGLGLDDIRGVSIPNADVAERAIKVETIKTAFARADRLEAEAARARALLDRLEAAILARAFRGELVPQDPTDEPATALLNRIREARAATPKPKRGRRVMAEA